tara:strand:- start:1440 stop:1664 length:225 start_codon:yes stop_codon:yes gene_type:complete
MENIVNVHLDKKFKNAKYATEDKSIISVETCIGQDTNGKDIFEATFVPCVVGNADWDAIQELKTPLSIADWKSV